MKNPFERVQNYLDPKIERVDKWTPALNVIVRLKSGPEADFSRLGLSRAGVSLNPDSLYKIADYRQEGDAYLLFLDEVHITGGPGRREIAIVKRLPDPLSIDLFEPAEEYDDRTT